MLNSNSHILILSFCLLGTYVDGGHYSDEAQRYRNIVKHLSEPSICDVECLDKLIEIENEKTADSTNAERPFVDPIIAPHVAVDPIECTGVPVNRRFDCFPGEGATQESCNSRGCCWSENTKSDSKNYYDVYPRSPPSCFYPPSYSGYTISSLTPTEYGTTGTLSRKTSSGFPDDVMKPRIDFIFETDSRIRVRVYDPSVNRWETPLPVVPEATGRAPNPLYYVQVFESSGDFVVFRNETNVPVFDTRNAAPLVFADQYLQLSSLLSSDYIYGLGQHLEGLNLDTYWHRRLLWNYDQGIVADSNLYGSHPFYMNFEYDGNVHGVFLLNSNTIDIIIQPAPAITIRALGGILDFYIFLGPTPKDVVQQYTDVIGKPFLPPYWSLGYHQCRYNYFSLNRTREVWQNTRDAGIPYDVQWNDIDSLEEFRIFTYNRTFFDGLPEFVDDLHAVNMKYIPIVDPGLPYGLDPGEYLPLDDALVADVLVKDDKGNDYVGRAWPGSTAWPDFTNPKTLSYWVEQYVTYHNLVGYDGAWLDMNEPPDFDRLTDQCNVSSSLNAPPYLPPVEGGFLSYRTLCMTSQQYISNHYNAHNLYSFAYSVATFNALKVVREQRPFIITRSTFPGIGSYAGHWTGDSRSTFEQLNSSIADVLNFNLYGIPMVGADICGFDLNTTVPLCHKWYLLGAFYPFCRNHNNEYCTPQDPVSLGEPIITVAKNSLFVRYRLLPFLYSLFFRAHLTGEPVARPLFYEFPEDKNTYLIDTQLMWGGALLLAPALSDVSDDFGVKAYMPKGLWYDWYSAELRYNSSGAYYDMTAPEDVPNVFIRGGFIVPIQEPDVTTFLSRKGTFALEVALNIEGTAEGELFWDDGESPTTLSDNAYNQFLFAADTNGLNVSNSGIGYPTTMNLHYIRVMGLYKEITEVTMNGLLSLPFNYTGSVLMVNTFDTSLITGGSFSIIW